MSRSLLSSSSSDAFAAQVDAEATPDGMFRRSLSREAEFVLLGARTFLSGERAARFDLLLGEDEPALNWNLVLRLCQKHRVLGLVGRALSARGWRGVPHPVALSWGHHFGAMALHSASLAGELGRVGEALENAGVPVVSFKGPTLAHSAYGNGAVRPCADLDVLVSRSHVRRAHEVLRSLGYAHEAQLSPAQERAHLRVDSVFNLQRPAPAALEHLFPEGFALELHWAITSPCLPFDLTFDDLAPRLGWMSLPGVPEPVRVLAPRDLLLILGVHGAKHLWERLIWLSDIAQLLHHTPDLDWDAVLRESHTRGVERMTALGLVLTRDVMGTLLPREVDFWLSRQPEVLRIASRLRASLLWHSEDNARQDSRANESGEEKTRPSWEANRLLAGLIDDPWKRAGFFWHIATTPSAVERQKIDLPAGLEPVWWVLGPLHAIHNRWPRKK